MNNGSERKGKDALKPCPFCGGKAYFYYSGGPSVGSFLEVICNDCGCRTDRLRDPVSIDVWNRRKVDTPTPPIAKEWNPNQCPSCEANIGGDCEDGVYENPHYDRCPECGQKLLWERS